MNKIIEHIDYNVPSNGDTVIDIVPNPLIKGEKAFKIMENIWIITEPVKKDIRKSAIKKYTVFDPEFGHTVAQKTKFIKETTVLFKRINQTQSGKHLLSMISNGLPLSPISSKKNVTYDFNRIPYTHNNNQSVATASLLIYPLKGSKEYFYVSDVSAPLGEVLTSGYSTLHFSPDLAMITKNKDGKLVAVDPAITLQHELVHVVHNLYGVSKFALIEETKDVEENLTFGGKDRDVVDPYIKSLDKKLRNQLEATAEEINNRPYVSSQKKYFAKKFLLEKQGNKYVVTDKGFNFFRYYMRDAFSESNFTLELGAQTRNRYSDGFLTAVEIDVSDENQYSAEHGITNGPLIEQNNLSIHPKTILLNQEPGENIAIDEFFKKCMNKRKVLNDNCMPLEEDFSDPYEGFVQKNVYSHDKKHNIQKRSEMCNTERILEDFDTVENGIYNLKNKLLNNIIENKNQTIPSADIMPKKVAFKTEGFPEFSKLDLEEKDLAFQPHTEETQNIQEIKTVCNSTSSLIQYNNNTAQTKLDAHRFNRDLDYKKFPIEIHSDKLNLCNTCGNQSFTHSTYITTMNGHINKATNALQLYSVISKAVDDFTVNSDATDAVHKFNDLAQLSPFVGSSIEHLKIVKTGSVAPMLGYISLALNLGVDIYDKNYVGLAEDIGIFLLLEAFPELTLPMMLFGVLEQFIETEINKAHRREAIKKSIYRILEQRDEYINVATDQSAVSWSHILYKKINAAIANIEKQLIYNANALIHNITYQANKLKVYDPKIKKKICKLETKMWKNINAIRISVTQTLYKQVLKSIIPAYKKNIAKISLGLTEKTKQIINDILSSDDPAINPSFVKECIDIMNSHIKRHNLAAQFATQIPILENLAQKELDILKRGYIPSSFVTVKDDKIVDLINTNIAPKVKSHNVVEGRAGKCFKVDDNIVTLVDDIYEQLNINHGFTVSFWMKLNKLPIKDACQIVQHGFQNNAGWQFSILNNKLTLDIFVNDKESTRLQSKEDIIVNQWHKITIVNSRKYASITLYQNEDNVATYYYTKTQRLTKNNINQLQLGNINGITNLLISNFKTYYTVFNQHDIISNYYRDFDVETIYDYNGEPLRENQKYYLTNLAFYETHGNMCQLHDAGLVTIEPKTLLTKNVNIIVKNSTHNFITNCDIVELKVDNWNLGLDESHINDPQKQVFIVPDTVTKKERKLKLLSSLWLEYKLKINQFKILKLTQYFKEDQFYHYACGIISIDAQGNNLLGILAAVYNNNTNVGEVFCTDSYFNNLSNTKATSNIIPFSKEIMDRGVYPTLDPLIDAFTFCFIKVDENI